MTPELVTDLINDSRHLVVDKLPKKTRSGSGRSDCSSETNRLRARIALIFSASRCNLLTFRARTRAKFIIRSCYGYHFCCAETPLHQGVRRKQKLTAEEAEKSKPCCSTARPAPTPSRGTLLSPAPRKEKRAWRNPRRAPMCSTNAKCWMLLTWWCSARKPRWTTPAGARCRSGRGRWSL